MTKQLNFHWTHNKNTKQIYRASAEAINFGVK